MEKKAYSIIAATCHGNRGAQAMLETVVGRLRELDPTLIFHVFSYYPDEDRRLISDPRVRVHSSTPAALAGWLLPWSLVFGLLRLLLGKRVLKLAPSAIRALSESVALVDLAGVAFIDGREKFLPFNILTMLPAWLLGTAVVKMPQAVGPFRHAGNHLAARVFLPMCRMIWTRGASTHEHLVEARFPGLRFAQADDIAFNFQERWSLTREGESSLEDWLTRLTDLRQQPGMRGVIGLCPSSVVAVKSRKEGGSYEPVLVQLIVELAREGFLVVLFPNATRDHAGEAERNNDLPVMRRLRDGCLQAGVERDPLLVEFDINAAGIKRVIAKMDIALVSRFHAMVGALSLGVPPVVLGWSHKYAEVMARFGLQGHVMDYQRLGLGELRTAVEEVFGRRTEVADRIRQRLPEIQANADRPVIALLTDSLGADLA